MRARGDAYEDRAWAWLRSRGWKLIARNFSARHGELDIVAQDGDQLVFVEVRSRSHARYAGAAGSVDWRKQRRLLRTAQAFLQQNPRWAQHPCRFDVVAFEPRQSPTGSAVPEGEPLWIRAAFTL